MLPPPSSFLLHFLLELLAGANFLLRPSHQLSTPVPQANAIIRQYGALLLSSSLICLAFANRDIDLVTRRVGGALSLYHLAPISRALSRVWRGSDGRFWPAVHFSLHLVAFVSLGSLWIGLGEGEGALSGITEAAARRADDSIWVEEPSFRLAISDRNIDLVVLDSFARDVMKRAWDLTLGWVPEGRISYSLDLQPPGINVNLLLWKFSAFWNQFTFKSIARHAFVGSISTIPETMVIPYRRSNEDCFDFQEVCSQYRISWIVTNALDHQNCPG